MCPTGVESSTPYPRKAKELESHILKRDVKAGKNFPHAFVQFSNTRGAAKALAALDGKHGDSYIQTLSGVDCLSKD